MLAGHCVCYICYLFVILPSLNLFEARPQTVKYLPGFLSENKPGNNLPKEELALTNKTKTRILNRGGFVNEYAEQDIVFPDSYRVVFEPLPKIQGPPKCAGGETYCEEFSAYPYNQIQDVLKQNNVRNDLFGKDEPSEDINIANRIGEDVEETFVCASDIRTVFPKIGKNKNNKWKYIINQADVDGYIQGVRIETCRRKDAPCDIIGELPNGYTTSCKQKYIFRRMMSITESGEPIPDTFQLPSACCCAYRKDIGFLTRFGSPSFPVKR